MLAVLVSYPSPGGWLCFCYKTLTSWATSGWQYTFCPSEMADEALFDFLHMEIVSHVYKHSSKGEIDNKVSKTIRAK